MRKSGKTLLILAFVSLLAMQSNFANGAPVSKKQHVGSFGRLLVIDHEGRIEPVNTLASDLLRKITKKDNWEGLSPVEFFIEMSANPDKWKTVPLVKVGNPELKRKLGISSDFVSFIQLFDQNGNYRLNDLVQQSYNKKQTSRNKFDKEVINLDERINICYQIFNGDFLKIFPVPGDEHKTWAIPSALPPTMKKDELDFAANILKLYYEEYNNSLNSGNWSKPEEYLGYIKKFQSTHAADVIPSESKISLEIVYNKLNIF